MRIGFLSAFNFGSSIGGVENHIYFISGEFAKLGHEVYLFQPVLDDFPGVNVSESNIHQLVKIVRIGVPAPFIIKSFFASGRIDRLGFASAFLYKARFFAATKIIADAVEKFDCDVIHQHDFISSLFASKRLAKGGHRVYLTNHTGEYLFLKKMLLGRLFLKWALRHYDCVIGPSLELTPVEYSNAVTIYNGVDSDVFVDFDSCKRTSVRKKLGLAPSDFVVLCPRRWAPTKGVIFLAKSIAQNEFPKEFKFLFAGSDYVGYPAYSDEVLGVLSECDSDSLRLLGNLSVSEMVSVYNAADVVVIPSLMEAVSLSAVEAMSCGAVVVSTNVGGMPELISDGVNGILIEAKSSSEIYRSLVELFQNPDYYSALRRAAFHTASRFQWRQIAKKTLDVYQGYSH